MPNETAMYVESEEERMCYLYDYYIEMHLTNFNGKALEKLISKKTDIKE